MQTWFFLLPNRLTAPNWITDRLIASSTPDSALRGMVLYYI